jgi:hypothetical protein
MADAEDLELQRSTPFVYGRALRSHEVLDRQDELRTIFNRVNNGDSTAIVGEAHIGKTSLLMKLADGITQKEYLGVGAESLTTAYIDLSAIGSDFTPAVFWEEVLAALKTSLADEILAEYRQQGRSVEYTRRFLEKFFSHLSSKGHRLWLLLDEFEQLLQHPGFKDPAFFALLRSLATRTNSLALVTASRSSVAELNEMGRGLIDSGSPFFNNLIDICLHPFNEKGLSEFWDYARGFSDVQQRFVRRIAGRHPFLLQAMAATLAETTGEERLSAAPQAFYDRIAFHFDDLWHGMDDITRTTAVILSLMELGGRALGQTFAFGEIEQVDPFGPELKKLEARGLAEKAGDGWQFDWEHLLVWRGEKWTVGSQAFAWWVRDVAVSGTRTLPDYEEWLENKRYRLFLTQEQWNKLVGMLRTAPEWATRGVGMLAQALLTELMRK